MVKGWLLVATQVLLLPGTSPQKPVIEALLSVAGLVLGFTVPLIPVLVRVTTSPAGLVIVTVSIPPVI